MTDRPLGQYCGLARAFEIIGSRWSVLVVRDLILGPKLFAELHETLPRVSAEILARRLADLVEAGVVRLGAAGAYELTGYGRALEPILLELGLWGARSLGDPSPGDLYSIDIAILALRSTFRPDRARGIRAGFEVRFGELVVGARVDDGVLTVEEGPLPGADLVIESPLLKHLMSGELSPTDALWLGLVEAKGDPSMITTFVRLFSIPAAPERIVS
ncbi:helix-turn-helix domain-containing protein [Amycolatopsis sp. DG1A-15b]|uniref:winged helix-turn-helix transcriptional regulator n=1 Tax=Amycolatopsis sp. DG1A-15b TaxID=3052846 RepID=UPI00255B4FE2|nr:helix-turn-helix domain-containing protein [Amycolatopsis sp. DG1A-15b]WIX92173.1 helix-turn-helix domain-containing protein [Amycolatopsis sp. DG1A-15b]